MGDDILVTLDPRQPDIQVTVEAPPPDIDVMISDIGLVGPTGPAGPAGPGAGAYAHTQTNASASWIITHGLNAYPTPTILLDTEPQRAILADLTYTDEDTLIVTFPTPVTGRAYL